MTTTCADVVARARAFSILNPSLVSDVSEMLSRIRADQQELCTMVAGVTRDFFQTVYHAGSTAGTQARTVDLNAIDPPLERILRVELPSGAEISQVDIVDPEAELAPRYLVRGTTLVEFKNEWNPGSSLGVALTLYYVYAPTNIDPAGTLAQLVTIPDPWTDLLVLSLAAYCVHKDVGREQAEYDRVTAMLEMRRNAFIEYLSHYGGLESRRFTLPVPSAAQHTKQ